MFGVGATALLTSGTNGWWKKEVQANRHIITFSFDDGFKKSTIETVEIFEKYELSACINVIATAHHDNFVLPNEWHQWKAGDFGLWNELKARGHEIMPHGYKHANLKESPVQAAKDLVNACLDYFSDHLQGFDSEEAVFNFPYNASSPEIEQWLLTKVKAFRTGGPPVNPLPYKGQRKLTCTSHGPGNIDQHLKGEIDKLLSIPSGWLIYNTHGLDTEGWGPVNADFLDRLLDQLLKIDTVEVLPAGAALSIAK